MPGPTLSCAHCGLPAPRTADAETASFCCAGCRTAYELLHACGLERYYSLRTSLGDSDERVPAAELASLSAYAHYDDPEFLDDHGHAEGQVELQLTGLHCAACVWVIDRVPQILDGVHSARVNLGTGRIRLSWDPDEVKLSQIASFLHRLGYPSHPLDGESERALRKDRRRELMRLAVAGACAGNVMLLSFALYADAFGNMQGPFVSFFELVSLALALPAVTYAAWPFYRGALAGLRVGRLHMDLPITLGILAGFGASAWAAITGVGDVYFDSVSTLVFLLLIGRYVQRRGQEIALSRTTMLHMLLPGTARRMGASGWETVPSRRLEPGDRVCVRVGESFPADGVLSRGTTSVDLSSLTGESRPLRASVGGRVFAGARNLSASVELDVEQVGSRTRVGSLAEQIEDAQKDRAPVVLLADRLAGWFVASVILLAVIGGVAWWVHDPSRVFDVVVSLLVISCPCALGLATPAALSIARARAAQRGILVRSPAALEHLARVRRVVIDKTGTLTHGSTRVAWASGIPEDLRPKIGALESRADHPVARALATWAEDSASEGVNVTDFVEHPGKGIEGRVEGSLIRIGRVGWLSSDAHDHAEQVDKALAGGHSPVMVEVDGRAVGVLAVGDTLRDDAQDAVRRLAAHGYEVELCSGDHPRIVESLAQQIGVRSAVGGISPEGKAKLVKGLLPAAMVGDGINDALALEAATVGIAVGGSTEVAMKVADVHMARSGMGTLVELLEGSRRTLSLIRRNLAFSLAYNLTFAGLALAGLISPLLAAIIMPVSSLTVLGSSILGRSFAPAPESAPEPSQSHPQTLRQQNTSLRTVAR